MNLLLPDEGQSGVGTAPASTPASSTGGDNAPAAGQPNPNAQQESVADETGFDIPGDVDLDSIDLLDGGGALPGESGPASAQPVATPPSPQAPVAPAPAAAPVPPQPAAPAAAAPAPAAQPQQTQTPSAQPSAPLDLGNIGQQLALNRDALIESWASDPQMFRLSEEEITGLQTNAETVIPKIAAKVLWHAMAAIPHQIQRFVPGLIGSQLETYARNQANEDAFFGMYPQIPRERSQEILPVINMWRSMNPQVNDSRMIMKGVGDLIVAMWGLQRAPAQRTTAAPFRPSAAAGPGGVPAGGRGNEPADPFDGMGLPE